MITTWPSVEVQEKICELYRAGDSCYVVSRKTRITIAWVKKVLIEKGVELRGRIEAVRLANSSRTLTEPVQSLIARMYTDGHSFSEVSALTGVPRTTLERVLTKHGVEKRSRTEALKLRAQRVRGL